MSVKLNELFSQSRDEVLLSLQTTPDNNSKIAEMQLFGTKVINECLDAVKDDAHAVQLIKQRFNIT